MCVYITIISIILVIISIVIIIVVQLDSFIHSNEESPKPTSSTEINHLNRLNPYITHIYISVSIYSTPLKNDGVRHLGL